MNHHSKEASELIEVGDIDQAIAVLSQDKSLGPARIQLQIARLLDSQGKEREAVPFYEKAIKLGLKGEDGLRAYLGLGSTYRCLGMYDESLRCFDEGIKYYPDHRGLKVFRALTLYNLGQGRDAVSVLLQELIATTNSNEIKNFEKALSFYADRLDEIW